LAYNAEHGLGAIVSRDSIYPRLVRHRHELELVEVFMSDERHFFEIPVYRVVEKAFYGQYQKDLTRHVQRMCQDASVAPGELPDWEGRVRETFTARYGLPWRYNQAVGWLRLFVLGTQIRADVWLAEGKRFTRRMPHKTFRTVGKAFEVWTFDTQTEEEIRSSVIDELRDLSESPPGGKKCVLDLAPFLEVAPCLRWRVLLGYDVVNSTT
jgi:hypothetical protein